MSACKRLAKLPAGLLAGLLAASLSVQAQERILAYESDVVIGADASLLVTETILVQAEGRQIRRGIYRDFPTQYEDRLGNNYQVDFTLLEVTRNGQPEPWHTENRSNGLRIYMGSANTMLQHGEHRYQLRYRTNRQLGYFDNYDELYWNVTGLGWAFPIERAMATLHLPEPVPAEQMRTAVYTGPSGSTAQAATTRIVDGSTVEWVSQGQLGPREGMTVALGFPKGLVYEPDTAERVGWFLQDNLGFLVLLVSLALCGAWYFRSWKQVGRDPDKGVIIPRFEPPKGLSAAACRYVLDLGLKAQCFTAAVISLGVKGYLRIDEDDDEFTLHRIPGDSGTGASPGEAAILEALLPHGVTEVELDDANHREFRTAHAGLKKALKAEYRGRLFNLNGRYALPPVLITIVGAVIAVVFTPPPLAWVAYAILSIALHITFIFLLRAPTPAGRKVMDEIEGFRMYLDTAERDRLERMRSPELTPEVFEQFLPYAFALGVENTWGERFQREFPALQDEKQGYQPAWYSGHLHGAAAMSHISSGFGSQFSGAISSASSPPGSSSGSGGGGSSGGGGGGGGGGGW